MPRKQQMSKGELVSFISQKIRGAMNREDGDISRQRERIFSQYYGGKQGNEREGKSGFISREVLEAVEWASPDITRMFFGPDRIVSFEPVGEDDMEAAQQETDYIQYAVRRANGGDGFVAIHSHIKDALMNPVAYLKVWVEEQERKTIHNAEAVTAEILAEMEKDESIELLEQDSRTLQLPISSDMPGAPPQTVDVEVFDLKYRETKKGKVFRIMGVPPEEVLVDPGLRTLDLDDAVFVCHRSLQNFTHLVEMGYDRTKLEEIGSSLEDATWNDERVNRLFYEDESPSHAGETDVTDDDSMRELWVYECYVWVDYEGDGLAKYRRIVMVGDDIFENEEADYQPLVAMSSILIPHKHNGMAVAELVSDLQTLISELTRELVNNVRDINTRRRFISENALIEDGSTYTAANNPAATLVPLRHGASVRDSVMPDPTTPIISELLPVIQDMRQATSLRTGISPENSVDPKVLQQSTYGAFMGAMEKANGRMEMIIRVMAETGVKQLYRKAHQLHRMYPDVMKMVKLRNEWIPVDPRGWRDRTDVKVNVGLGFANKQQMLTSNMQILELQQQVASHGLADEKGVYHSLSKLVEMSSLGAPEFYFKDPSDPNWQPPQPQPDPQAMLFAAQAESLKAQVQIEGQKAQASAQQAMAKLQNESMKDAAAAEAQRIEGEIKLRELALREKEQESRARVNQVDMLKTTAEIENTEADTELKVAQASTELVEAGKKGAEIGKIEVEASDEFRQAKMASKKGKKDNA